MGELEQNYIITKIGNLRYRQLQIGNEYYLLDLDTHIWTWLVPASVWWFPMRAYRLQGPKSFVGKKQPSISPYLVSSLVAIIFTRFPLGHTIENQFFAISIVLGGCLLLFLARLVWSKQQVVNIADVKTVRIDFSKSSRLNYLKRMVFPILFLFTLLFVGAYYFLMGELLGIVVVFILFLMLLNTSGASVVPDDIEKITWML
ncbi:TPA: DUF443 family protein [Streptococcus suis]|uniref:DUF443 family protein n=2 Tax=Streptococcus TaxID=1301 RepID=A0A4T2GKS5_STRSU|nr:DUF443 family protein [Streptococcus sp. 29896]MBL6538038.1 DUF443 family protein [Streptococcus suis]MBM7270189.1 DUF443 family protein [Streptococcus suis]MBM7314560.1 DUF443 family protein [Streptococcus suis]MCK4027709.1 DUF443 family protein [Streptococcus suis]TIH99437.1 DUF443 family protein [Streptococcus suis]